MPRNDAAMGGGEEDIHEQETRRPQGDGQESGEFGDETGQGAAEQGTGEEEATGLREGQEVEEGDGETPARGRAATRIDRILSRLEAAEARAQAAEDELRASRSVQQNPQVRGPQIETDEQFAARVRDLPYEERLEARMVRSERIAQIRDGIRETNNNLSLDRANYDARCASSSLHQKYKARVEAELNKALRGEQVAWSAPANAPREAILKYLIGEAAIATAEKEVERQREQGQRNIRRQQTKPSNTRGEVPANRGRGAPDEREARRRRLENQTF